MNAKLHSSIVLLALLASPVGAVDTAIPFIQADDVHALGILGQKVVVAVVDTGVDYGDPDLAGKTAPRGRTYYQGQVVGGDGAADFGDINPFVTYQSNFGVWQAEFPGCNPVNGDINCDGTYGQGSFDDINPFVVLMGQCGMGCACPGPIVCP